VNPFALQSHNPDAPFDVIHTPAPAEWGIAAMFAVSPVP
jgi:hypothetical protein